MREKMTNTNTQTKNITWNESNRWLASVGIIGSTFGLMYWLYTSGWLIYFCLGTFLTFLFTVAVILVKHLVVDELME